MMRVAISRAVLLGSGLALLLAALLTALARPVEAAPALLITETPTAEPPTRTATTSPPTNTPPPSNETPVPPTDTPVPPPTDSPGDGGGGDAPPPSTSTPTATATATAQIADPAITKSASITSVRVGDTVEFTISATNLGNATANNVVIEDALPSFLSLDGVSATRGNVSVNGATVRVEIGDLAPGEVVEVTITTRVIAAPAAPNNSNVATVASTSDTDDPGNNSSSVTLQLAQLTPAVLPTTGDSDLPVLPILTALGLLMIAVSLLAWRRKA